jgi:hypothetical protein
MRHRVYTSNHRSSFLSLSPGALRNGRWPPTSLDSHPHLTQSMFVHVWTRSTIFSIQCLGNFKDHRKIFFFYFLFSERNLILGWQNFENFLKFDYIKNNFRIWFNNLNTIWEIPCGNQFQVYRSNWGRWYCYYCYYYLVGFRLGLFHWPLHVTIDRVNGPMAYMSNCPPTPPAHVHTFLHVSLSFSIPRLVDFSGASLAQHFVMGQI